MKESLFTRVRVAGIVLLASVLAIPSVLASPPGNIWTEKPVTKPLDPNAPVSMRAFATLARELGPAVVNVVVKKSSRGGRWGGHGGGDGQSVGSGFIINANGFALTNNHVVDGAIAISVKLRNGNAYDAKVVGSDPKLDVALLKFKAPKESLRVAPLADSDRLEIGEWVIAIGNPFGLNHTVTAGIVSAKGRKDVQPGNRPMYANFIQTDASINPGNSGGPLINIRGEVVGINTAINSAGQGIGFAVPINMVKTILPQLATGKVRRSFLGVKIGPVPPELASRRGMKRALGALVHEVIRGTPAEAAGVKAGDVITHWEGKVIKHWGDLPWLASTAGARKVSVRIKRPTGEVTVGVTLKVRDEARTASASRKLREGRGPSSSAVVESLGFRIMSLPASLRLRLRLAKSIGVVVAEVDRGSAAYAAGLEAGDVIIAVDHVAASSQPKAVKKALDRIARGAIVALNTLRGEREIFVTFKK